ATPEKSSSRRPENQTAVLPIGEDQNFLLLKKRSSHQQPVRSAAANQPDLNWSRAAVEQRGAEALRSQSPISPSSRRCRSRERRRAGHPGPAPLSRRLRRAADRAAQDRCSLLRTNLNSRAVPLKSKDREQLCSLGAADQRDSNHHRPDRVAVTGKAPA
ncbi:hypothetical protein HAX54_052103, partial [Datura stramonium]|nr:hypothetical protein [Datura stramonium]